MMIEFLFPMILLKLVACLVFFIFLGWIGRRLFCSRDETGVEELLFHLLTGMALLSLLYFGLATGGWFHGKIIAGASLFLALALWLISDRQLPPQKKLRLLLLAPLLCALAAMLFYRLTPPFEAVAGGDDASVYSAAAAQLAHSGKMSYRDSLVLEMTAPQREAFFRNRYREDWTGPYARFPGGVRLMDPQTGEVHFAFYHMAPVWLAFSIKLFGLVSYEIWLSLISTFTLLVLFFLGKRMGGIPVGIALPAILFLFYPQQYFSRFPLSEPLAQLFFLAGLLSLAQNLDETSGPHPAGLRRTGLLWGVSFLCRVDAIYVIAVFLAVGLLALPVFARNRRRWLPLLRIPAVCALAAFLNQLAAGEYISVFTNTENLGQSALTDLGLDLITDASGFVHSHTGLIGWLFFGLAAIILFAPWPTMRAHPQSIPPSFRVPLALIAAVMLLLPVTGTPPSLTLLAHHARWFAPYAPAALYLFLAAGALILAFCDGRQHSVRICLLLLALSAAAYLFRPMILPGQPWSMRRFVPILIPLFFLLGLAGWSRTIRLLRPAGPWSHAILFFAAAGACGLLLYSKTGYLLGEPLFRGVISRCDALAAQVPRGALVLIPDAMAGLHLELPLQYRNGVDTLMLPLDYKTGRLFDPTVRDFLEARLQRSPVIVLSSEGTDLIYPMWQYFRPVQLGKTPFPILLVPTADRYRYPQTERMNFDVTLYELSSARYSPPSASVLSYDDPKITFLHFHEKEAGFRWTRDESILSDFAFPTHGKDVELLIEVGPLPPGFRPDQDLAVAANYSIPAEFIRQEGHTLCYKMHGARAEEIRAISLRTRTFREQTGTPPRDLGISFVKLTFQ